MISKKLKIISIKHIVPKKINFKEILYFLTFTIIISYLAKNQSTIKTEIRYRKFINNISEHDLNKLFGILQNFEIRFANKQSIIDNLDLISFSKLKTNKRENRMQYEYKNEVDKYLSLDNKNNIVSNPELVKYLNNISDYYTYRRPRECIFQLGSCKLTSLKQVNIISLRYH